MKEKIKLLLEKKKRNDELSRIIALYEGVDNFLKGRLYHAGKVQLAKLDCFAQNTISCFCLVDAEGLGYNSIDIKPTYEELSHALHDYYEKKILELSGNESSTIK